MKSIRTDIDDAIKRWQTIQTTADVMKRKILEQCATMTKNEMITTMNYVKPKAILNRENATIIALKYSIPVPTKTKVETDWGALESALKAEEDNFDAEDEIWKERAGYLSKKKKGGIR